MDSKAIPKIIHQIWYQGQKFLPEKHHSMQESWHKHHPDWQYIFWDKDKIKQLVAKYPDVERLYNYFPRMIMKIDLAKLIIMYEYGGVYVDMDMTSLRPIDPLLQNAKLIFSELDLGDTQGFSFQLWGGTMGKCTIGKAYNNAFFASIPKHPFWLHVLKAVEENKIHHWYQPKTLYMLNSTGPMLLTYILQTEPPKDMKSYPSKILESPTITEEAYAVHHFANTWASSGDNILKHLYNPWIILFLVIALAVFWCLYLC